MWVTTSPTIVAIDGLMQRRQELRLTTLSHQNHPQTSVSLLGYLFLVNIFSRLQSDRFKLLIAKLQSFISCRLFPPKPQDLPPMAKCTWWIPSATKVLALLSESLVTSYELHDISNLWWLDRLFNSLFMLIIKKTSKLNIITGPLWGKTTGDWWIPLTKGQ